MREGNLIHPGFQTQCRCNQLSLVSLNKTFKCFSHTKCVSDSCYLENLPKFIIFALNERSHWFFMLHCWEYPSTIRTVIHFQPQADGTSCCRTRVWLSHTYQPTVSLFCWYSQTYLSRKHNLHDMVLSLLFLRKDCLYCKLISMVTITRKLTYFSRQQYYMVSPLSSFHQDQAIHIVKASVEGIVGSSPSWWGTPVHWKNISSAF